MIQPARASVWCLLLGLVFLAGGPAFHAGASSVRHAARAGGDAAGVAEEAARHVPAGADAQARHRHVGRADARVQRGPGLLRDHRAGNVRRAAAHHLRLLRQLRRGGRAAVTTACVERIALGGTSQGGVFEARRSTKAAAGNVGRGQQAELWGDEQWQVLKAVIEERKPRVIGINRSTVFAFSDGLSSGELKGMSAALGDTWTSKFKDAEAAAARADRVAAARGRSVLPPDAGARLVDDADDVLGEADHAGHDADERPRVVVAAARQRSGARDVVPAERLRAAQGHDGRAARRRSDHPARRRAPLRRRHHRRAAEHRHAAQRVRPAAGRDRRARRAPRARSRTRNALQDIVMDEIRPGRTGNEILAASRARMKAKGINGTVYSHPDRPARPRRGAADRPVGLPGRRARPRRRAR